MRKIISAILALALVVNVCMPLTAANAKTIPASGGSYLEKTQVSTFKSNDPMCDQDEKDRVELTASGHFLTVDFSNSEDVLEYRVALTKPGYTKVLGYEDPINGSFYRNYYVGYIPDGRYYVLISRAKNLEQIDHINPKKYGDGGTYRVTTVTMKNGNISIEKYDNIIRKNQELREYKNLENPDWHLDPTLRDMDFILNDANAKPCYGLTEGEIAYIRSVAEKITAGCYTDYEKARAIYHYIGENVYYDVYCNQNDPKDAYLHPYRNLQAIEMGIKKPNSTGDCKVATLCTGYASMNIAMLRALGIPARMVFGFHMNTGKDMWETASGVETRSTHYWTEFYYDGKWMSCDSYKAGANKWNRQGLDDPGRWVTRGFTNYARFNPTEQQFAVEHYGQGVFTKTILGDKSDISKLNDILLEQDINGECNFSKVGLTLDDINQDGNNLYLRNPAVMYSQTKGDKLQKVNWSGKDVDFDGKFKDFHGLKWLNVNNNPELDYLTVTNDKEILSVYAKGCNIKNFYALNCPNLNRLYTEGNPLKYAKYAFKEPPVPPAPKPENPDNPINPGEQVDQGTIQNRNNNPQNVGASTKPEGQKNGTPHATIRTTKGGTFEIEYVKGVHKLKAKCDKGYKFNGWFDENGKRVSKYMGITVKKAESFERKASFVKIKPPAKKPNKQKQPKAKVKKQTAVKPIIDHQNNKLQEHLNDDNINTMEPETNPGDNPIKSPIDIGDYPVTKPEDGTINGTVNGPVNGSTKNHNTYPINGMVSDQLKKYDYGQ